MYKMGKRSKQKDIKLNYPNKKKIFSGQHTFLFLMYNCKFNLWSRTTFINIRLLIKDIINFMLKLILNLKLLFLKRGVLISNV